MRIVRGSGDLIQETWNFSISMEMGRGCIYFDFYRFETKRTPRCRNWQTIGQWGRTNLRTNTIENPPLPADVITEMRDYFRAKIDNLEIKK